jgi:hypothetical protein
MLCTDETTATALERIVAIAQAESEVISHVHQLRMTLLDLGDTRVSAHAVADELALALAPIDVHLQVDEACPGPDPVPQTEGFS